MLPIAVCLNLNDQIEVELTEVGAKLLHAYYDRLMANTSKAARDRVLAHIAGMVAGSVWKAQLHEFAAILGPHCGIGREPPIARLEIVCRDAETLSDALLKRLVYAKREKDEHGDTPTYKLLKAGLWDRAKLHVETRT